LSRTQKNGKFLFGIGYKKKCKISILFFSSNKKVVVFLREFIIYKRVYKFQDLGNWSWDWLLA